MRRLQQALAKVEQAKRPDAIDPAVAAELTLRLNRLIGSLR